MGSTAYGPIDFKRGEVKGLPESNLTIPKTGEAIIFDKFNIKTDEEGLYQIWVEVIEEGQTYPYDKSDRETFTACFLCPDVFVIRLADTKEVIASFYIKPNFPGRSSHIANGGFMVRLDYRGKGLSSLLMKRWIKHARELGYRALYTNLVYVTNSASIKMCLSHGFREVGRLPEAGNLKGLGYTDALQLYCSLVENANENKN